MRLRRKLSEKQILMVYKFYKTTQRFFVILALTGILFSLFPNQKFYAATEVDTKPETVEKDYYQSSDVDISLVPIVEEDVSKRTANEKHFRKLDGTYEVALYDNEVHYYENGTWHDIDNSFIDNGNKLENKQNAFKTFFPKNLSDNKSIQIKTKDYSIDWRVIDIDKTSAEYVTNNQKQNVKNELNSIDQSVFYSNIRPNVDLEYILQGSDVKEYIILNDFIDNFSISFEYSLKNLKLVKLSDGIFFVDLNGEKVFEFEDLFMFDSNNEVSSDVEIEIIETKKDTYLVTVLPNLDWLSSAAYPVKIDPSLSSSQSPFSILDTYISEQNPYTNYNSSIYMKLSNTSASAKFKGLISFTIPAVAMTQVITYAHLSFTPYQVTNNAQLNIYKNTSYFTNSTVTWNGWHSAQNYDTSVVDYHIINLVNPFVFDITESVKEWQTQGISAVPGFTISQDDDFGSVNTVYQNEASDVFKRPVIKIGYEDPSGLKDYWTYTSQNVGMNGTGYISDYSGNLTFVRDDYKLENEFMSLVLSFFHNSYTRNVDIGYGKGWRTNYSIQMIYDSTVGLYYMHKPDGSKVYFGDYSCYLDFGITSCTAVSEDGSRMKFNSVMANGQLLTFNVKTVAGLVYEFDSLGRLITIKNSKTNHSLWVYYVDSTSLRINYVKDEVDNRISFSYISNRLRQTKLSLKQDDNTYYDVERRDHIYDSNGNLYYIDYDFRYGNEQNTDWTTDIDNRLQYRFDSNNRLIEAYNDKDVFKVVYTYDTLNRVTNFSSSNNGLPVGNTSISYLPSKTVYTNYENRKVTYVFDHYGHTINIMDDYGNTAYYRYSGLFSFDYNPGSYVSGYDLSNVLPNYYNNHRLVESSDLMKQIQNPIQNHGFEESTYGWSLYQGTGSISFTDETSLLGETSLKITRVSSTVYAYQQLYLTQGNYKIEGWIKNNGAAPGAYIDIENASSKDPIIKVYQKNDWSKYELNFTINTPTNISVKLVNESNSSSAYFDNIQISKGFVDTRYNTVNNSSFENGISGWTVSGATAVNINETGTLKEILGNRAIKIDGDAGVNNQLYQQLSYVNGYQGLTLVVGGWAKADAVPNKGYLVNQLLQRDTRFFGIVLEVEMAADVPGPHVYESFYYPFNASVEDWQYQMYTLSLSKTVYSVKVYVRYNGEGTAYFDNIQLYQDDISTKYMYDESTGNLEKIQSPDGSITEYGYDTNGNIVSVTEDNKTTLIERNATYQVEEVVSQNNIRTTLVYNSTTKQLVETYVGYDPSQSSSTKWFKSSTTYTADNQYINTVKDEFGNTTTWNVDKKIGTITEIIDAIGNIQTFEYDEYGNLIRVVMNNSTLTDFLEGEYQYDSIGRLWKIVRDGYAYEFTYNPLNQITGVEIADVNVMSYEYWTDSSGVYYTDLLKKQIYGNSDYVEFTYTDEKQIKSVKFNTTIRYEYEYDSMGKLSIYKDIHNNNIYFYSYDLAGRIEYITDKNGNQITFDYDSSGNLKTYKYEISGLTREVKFNYNSTTGQYDYTQYYVGGTLIKNDFNYDIDSLKRLNNIELSIGGIVFRKIFGYDDGNVNSSMGNATNRIYQITYQKGDDTLYTHQYTYDANHNVTRILISIPDGQSEQYDYYYDGFNQLIREDIEIDGQSKTLVYSYDSQNNITSIKTYNRNTISGTPLSEKKMYYQNTWKDQLTRVEYYTNGTLNYYETMTYDNSGNIINLVDSRTSYLNKSYQWDGRQLTNYGSYCNSLTFKYNDQGIRTQKIYNACGSSITTNYVLDGDKVLVETRSNGITIYYTYDVDGSLLSMNYNGTEYFYITNLQGDIIELRDMSGSVVVEYKYDAWGNMVYKSPGTLADINPYRYRGYRFDVETGYYYLQSRYYNPQIGRFISADGLVGEKGNLLTQNMYAYAGNNPVMNVDPNGYEITIGAILTAVSIVVLTTVLIYYISVMTSDSALTMNGPTLNDINTKIKDTTSKIRNQLAMLSIMLAGLVISNLSSLGKRDLHHIVAKRDFRAYFSREVLNKANIGINDTKNTVYVSRPLHWVMHTNEYHAIVTVTLWAAYSVNGEEGVIDALRGMKEIIEGVSNVIG